MIMIMIMMMMMMTMIIIIMNKERNCKDIIMYRGREGAEDLFVAKLVSGGGRKQSGLVCR